MGNHVALLLVFMLLLKYGLTTLNWNHGAFDKPLQIVSKSLPCGIKSGVEQWQATVTVNYNDEDNVNYEKVVRIRTTDDYICTIDYGDCFSSIDSIPSTVGCFCSNGTNGVYTFKIKQPGIAALSLKQVGAEIIKISESPGGGRNTYLTMMEETIIGDLPLIYDSVSASCNVNELSVSLEPPSNTIIGNGSLASATVKCCANNLITPYNVQISINDNVVSTATNTPCVSTTNTYDFVALSSYKVNFKYEETSDNCRRTDDNLNFFITSGSTSGSVEGLVGAIMFVVIGQFLI